MWHWFLLVFEMRLSSLQWRAKIEAGRPVGWSVDRFFVNAAGSILHPSLLYSFPGRLSPMDWIMWTRWWVFCVCWLMIGTCRLENGRKVRAQGAFSLLALLWSHSSGRISAWLWLLRGSLSFTFPSRVSSAWSSSCLEAVMVSCCRWYLGASPSPNSPFTEVLSHTGQRTLFPAATWLI